MKKIIAIIGDAIIEPNGDKYKFAYETGKAIVDAGFRLQTGGLRGVMQAAMAGAKASKNYVDGDTIAILPMWDATCANEYADIVIPTGLDIYRNVIVASAAAVVAVGGGAGTLCEIANAWALKRLLIACETVDGWSGKVAGIRMDNRIRYDDIPEDKVFPAKTAEDVVYYLKKYVERYDSYYGGIKPNN